MEAILDRGAREGAWPLPRARVQRRATSRALLRRVVGLALAAVLLAMGTAVPAVVLPWAFGYEPMVVHSDSMGDSYPVGSLVIGHREDANDVDEGDVIVLRGPGDTDQEPVVHRVVDKRRTDGQLVVRTRGDANAAPDPERYVLPERVLVAGARVPYLGYFVAVISTPVGWVLFMVLPACALACASIVWIWRRP